MLYHQQQNRTPPLLRPVLTSLLHSSGYHVDTSSFDDIKLKILCFRRLTSIHTSGWIDLWLMKITIYSITSLMTEKKQDSVDLDFIAFLSDSAAL